MQIKLDAETRWLITGGCGFIGTSFVAHLKRTWPNSFIRVFDNMTVGTREDLARAAGCLPAELSIAPTGNDMDVGLELVVGDIQDYNACRTASEGIDVVVHLAANTGVAPSVADPRSDMQTNVGGTFNVLEAARHNLVKRVVFASSGAPVGECEPPIHEELAPHPVSPYGASKLAGEGYCSAFYRSFGLETVSLRFGNVYGPFSRHKSSVVAKFIRRALDGLPLEIYGDGTQTRDFIYIEDLVRAILAAASEDAAGEVFQIATSAESTVSRIAEMLEQILLNRGIGPVVFVHVSPRTGDVKRNYSDTSKAISRLGWHSEMELEQGLLQTVDWFLAKKSSE